MNKIFNIDSICKKLNIVNYTVNKDGSIDVKQNVKIINKNLKGLPIKFNIIEGDFKCHINKLKTLYNAPKIVHGCFNCGDNNLVSLENGPEYVGHDYFCHINNLKTLRGSPNTINGNFNCSFNLLTNLKYAPVNIKGDFICNNNFLNSLKYCPKYIKGLLDVRFNNIKTFEGFETSFFEKINLENNPLYNVWILFEDPDKIELFNDMDIIRENSTGDDYVIILDRLNEFLDIIGKEGTEYVSGYINI